MNDLKLYDLILKAVINYNDPDLSSKVLKDIKERGVYIHEIDLGKGSKYAKLGVGDTRRRKIWLNVSKCITNAGAKYRDRYNSIVEPTNTLDEIDPNGQFLEGVRVDEGHRFHTFVFNRAVSEHVSHSTIPYEILFMFYCEYAVELGCFKRVSVYFQIMQSILHMTDYLPYTMMNKQLKMVKVRYDIISVMEVLLTAILLTIDVGDVKVGRYSTDKIIYEYALGLIPRPKTVNNKVRTATTWLFKKYGLFSEFINVNVTDDYLLNDISARTIHPTNFVRIRSPNYEYRNAKVYIRGKLEAIAAFKDANMHTLALMAENSLIDEADYSKIEDVKLSALLLSLAQMGGYGRAWKRTSAPESVVDDKNTRTETFFNNLIQLHTEAVKENITKVQEYKESISRHFFTQMKTTGAGQSKKFEFQSSEGMVKISSTKKPLIILTEGYKVMDVKKQTIQDYNESGSRDVPVKATRLIFPIRTGTLLKQSLVSHQSLRVSSRTEESLSHDRPLYAKVAVGSGETTGSRIIDDAWIINISGCSHNTRLPFGNDFSAFDSHMTWSNFREPQIAAKKLIALKEDMKYFDLTGDELVEQAYGQGYMHGTYWNVGRKIGYCRKTEPSVPSTMRKPLRAPPGVRSVAKMDEVMIEPDDVLACVLDGSDLIYLESHGSGEITTLLDNTIHNLSVMSDTLNRIAKEFPMKFEIIREQYVGDDSQIEIAFETKLTVEEFDNFLESVVTETKKLGHDVNPVKMNATFLSAEFRATHAKCGVYFGQDRIMIHSRENPSNTEDIAGALNSFASLVMEKHARGFKRETGHMLVSLMAAHLNTYRIGRAKVTTSGIVPIDGESDNRIIVFVHPLVMAVPRAYGGAGICPFNIGVRNTPHEYLSGMNDEEINILTSLRKIFGKIGLLKTDFELDKEMVNSAFKYANGELLNDAIGSERMKPKNVEFVKNLIGFDLRSVARRTFTHWIKSEPGLRVRSSRSIGSVTTNYISDIYNFSVGKKRYIERKYDGITNDINNVKTRVMFGEYANDWIDVNLDPMYLNLRKLFGVRQNRRLPNRRPVDLRDLFRADPFVSNVWRIDELIDLASFAQLKSREMGLNVELFFEMVGFNKVDASRIALTLSNLEPRELLETEIDGMLSDGFSATLGVLNDSRTVSRLGSTNRNVNQYVVTVLQNSLYRWFSALSVGRGYEPKCTFNNVEDPLSRSIEEYSTLDFENEIVSDGNKLATAMQKRVEKLFKARGINSLISLRDY